MNSTKTNITTKALIFSPPHFAPNGRIWETTPHLLKTAQLVPIFRDLQTREKSGRKRAVFSHRTTTFFNIFKHNFKVLESDWFCIWWGNLHSFHFFGFIIFFYLSNIIIYRI